MVYGHMFTTAMLLVVRFGHARETIIRTLFSRVNLLFFLCLRSVMDLKEKKKRKSEGEYDYEGEEGAYGGRGENSCGDREHNNRRYKAREGEIKNNRGVCG